MLQARFLLCVFKNFYNVRILHPSSKLLTNIRPRIDVLANVAGIMDSFSSADTVTDMEWNKVLGINLNAPTKMMRAVLVYMKEAKSGAIVNVSSKAGVSGASSGIAYTASKHGLVSYFVDVAASWLISGQIGATRHVAWRFHEEGIGCNAVLPGGVFLSHISFFSQILRI